MLGNDKILKLGAAIVAAAVAVAAYVGDATIAEKVCQAIIGIGAALGIASTTSRASK